MNVGDIFNPFGLFVGAHVPNCILRLQSLTSTDKLVWARLAQYAGRDGRCWPKQSVLAEQIGCGVTSIQDSLKHLQDQGFIMVVSPTGQERLKHKTNHYVFLWHQVMEDSLFAAQPQDSGTPNPGIRVSGHLESGCPNEENHYEENQKEKNNMSEPQIVRSTRTIPNLTPPKKPSATERSENFLPIADQLAEIVQNKRKIRIPPLQRKNWAYDIRKITEELHVNPARIKRLLTWYSEHVDDEYTPVIESGSSLFHKFSKLVAAKERQEQQGPNPTTRSKPSFEKQEQPFHKIKETVIHV